MYLSPRRSDSGAYGDTCFGAGKGSGTHVTAIALPSGVRCRAVWSANDNWSCLATLLGKVAWGDDPMRLIFGHLIDHLDKFTSVMVALLGHLMSNASNLVVVTVGHLKSSLQVIPEG